MVMIKTVDFTYCWKQELSMVVIVIKQTVKGTVKGKWKGL